MDWLRIIENTLQAGFGRDAVVYAIDLHKRRADLNG